MLGAVRGLFTPPWITSTSSKVELLPFLVRVGWPQRSEGGTDFSALRTVSFVASNLDAVGMAAFAVRIEIVCYVVCNGLAVP